MKIFNFLSTLFAGNKYSISQESSVLADFKNRIIQFILPSSTFKKKNLKEFRPLDLAKFSLKTRPTAFYHPDHLNTKCDF